MPTAQELRLRANDLANQARAVLEGVPDDATPEAAAEAEQRFDAMISEADGLEQRAGRLEQSEQMAARLEAATEAAEERRRAGQRPGAAPVDAPGVDAPPAVEYRDAFHALLRARGSLAELPPEIRTAVENGRDPVERRAAMVAGVSAQGGFMVPTELQNIFVETMAHIGDMTNPDVVTLLETEGGQPFTMPTMDDTANEGEDATEGADMGRDSNDEFTIGQAELSAFPSKTGFIPISYELLMDSPFAVEQAFGMAAAERLRRRENRQLTTGTGVGQPNGVATAATTGISAAATAAVTYNEIVDLEHSVDYAYRQMGGCRFMFNDTTLNALRKLTDGDGNLLWVQGNIRAGVPNSFNGYPYSVNNAMPGIATGNDAILFGDFKRYYVRRSGGILVLIATDSRYQPGIGLAAYTRIDGELADAAAIRALTLA